MSIFLCFGLSLPLPLPAGMEKRKKKKIRPIEFPVPQALLSRCLWRPSAGPGVFAFLSPLPKAGLVNSPLLGAALPIPSCWPQATLHHNPGPQERGQGGGEGGEAVVCWVEF